MQQVQVLHECLDQRAVISAIELFSPLSSLIMGWTTANPPPINQSPVGVLALTELLTSQKCKQKCGNNKTKGKTRQATPACHRCLRIDFFPPLLVGENG